MPRPRAAVLALTRAMARRTAATASGSTPSAGDDPHAPDADSWTRGIRREEGRGIPLGRVGEPEDIARCALFLASDERLVHFGRAIVADGGAMAAADW